MKSEEARKIVLDCIGKKGVWASNQRYMHQCWTRDFVIAVLPYLLESGDEASLLIAKSHLEQLARRQKQNGKIPILFLDNVFAWLKIKFSNFRETGRMPFMLKQFFSRDGVFNLTPWTKDSELLYVLGVGMYYQATGDMMFIERHCKNVDRAFNYIKQNLLYKGMMFGSDWRDTRPDYFRTMLLTNNCFLYQAYKLHGMHKQAENLKGKINKNFWTGKYYLDFIGANQFDTLGNTLAIIFGVADESKYKSVFEEAKSLYTPHGFKLNGVTLPPKDRKEAELMSRIKQNGVIWPYIHGFMIMALSKMGNAEQQFAKEAFDKWNEMNGFYEFYDPETGEGHGSKDQLWSACLYLRCQNLYNK